MMVVKKGDRRHNKIFRSGLSLCISKSVWEKMKRDIATTLGIEFPIPAKGAERTKDRIMGLIHHDPADFSRFENGAMSDGAIFTAMTLLRWRGADLDELPNLEDRMISGFQYIIYKLRGGKSAHPKSTDSKMIHPSIFLTVRSLWKYFFENRIDSETLAVEDWDNLHKQFAPTLPGGGSYLQQNYYEWHEHVVEAFDGISYQWKDFIE